ncbi:MAG: hypothetical protein CML67_02210 [Rhodobacteraceae bacterium]|nr:hypothetical protein [Paracoccaceae bacterium]
MKNRRLPAPDGLDFFPTPPWATRALMLMLFDFLPRISLGRNQWRMETAWDPCCGAGHMSGVLRETFSTVHESDVHPYGQDTVLDFLDTEFCADPDLDAIVMNPPFNKAAAFVRHALSHRPAIVAALVRSNWIEGKTRYATLFRDRPPTAVFQFVERVPMVAGRWAINARTATSYAWFVWVDSLYPTVAENAPLLRFIPPCRQTLSRDDDVLRFGGCSDLPKTHPVMRGLEGKTR